LFGKISFLWSRYGAGTGTGTVTFQKLEPEPGTAAAQRIPDVVAAQYRHPKPLHSVEHHIDTGSVAPIFARPRRLDPEKQHVAEEEFLALEKAGIIRHSNSPWVSLLHLVPKKDGSWHPCSDYRCLNAVTVPDRYTLPNMHSLNDHMAGCPFFLKLT
jgi:hypothetical protein